MKRILLSLALFTFFFAFKTSAQVINYDFENWSIDTLIIPSGTFGSLPADTEIFNNPVGWTTSNVLTDLDTSGQVKLVTQSSHSYTGSSAIQLYTDTLKNPLISKIPVQILTVPGFAVNGVFPFSNISIGHLDVISPADIPGAGQPITQRLATIGGFYNYSPAYNPNTSSNDTCIVWAVLKKGSEVVANAIFKSTDSTNGYKPFTAQFVYTSCDMPDTLAILLGSSVPNLYPIAGLVNGLVPGSLLLVDNLYYDTLLPSHIFAPLAQNDVATVAKNTTDTINVLANDTDCNDLALRVSIISGPNSGTATVVNNEIRYTPNTDFTGLDTIVYQDEDPDDNTAQATLQIFVSGALGINGISNLINVHLYPVPASNSLNIQFENPGKSVAEVYDLAGNLLSISELTGNENVLNTSALSSGLYLLQIKDSENSIISRSKFSVMK